ncbi:hypothetical protein JCM10207_006860 [Rhodosporidiobolus poonsookiae]
MARLAEPVSVDDLQWDNSKLEAAAAAGAERGDLYLLNWLSACEKAVLELPQSAIYAEQSRLTTSLLSLITPPAQTATVPTVKPGRPARALIARILIAVIQRGDAKGLFDVAQALLRGMSGGEYKGAPEREKEWRIACAFVLGELYAVLGSHVMSLYIEITNTTLRIFRTSSYPVILRYSALSCLHKVIGVVAKSMSDQTAKETMKALRGGLGEKVGAIVRGCADCLLAMSASPGTYLSLADINEVLLPSFRALETADFVTRRSLSRLVAGLLAATQVEGSAAPVPASKKKKSNKEGEEEEDDEVGPSTGEGATKTLLSPIEMLAQLSSPYNRSSTSRRLRNALIDVYAELFKTLGSSWVEHYYADIAKHVIDEVGCGAAAGLGWVGWSARAAERIDPAKARYDALAARKAVSILLGDVVSGQLLSEAGQIAALREIGTLYLKRWPSLMPSQPPPSKQSLLAALDEATGLLRSLGCAPSAGQDVLYDPLVRLVSHPSHSVQVAAAWALRTFCNAAPNRLSSTLIHVLDLLNKDLTGIASDGPSQNANVHRRATGYAHALAALINLIPHKPLYVSFDLSAKCMSLAIQLLKQSGNHELHISGVEIQVAWILVGALMSLGPNFVRLHLPQLLILWRNALPKPTSKDASAAQVRGDNEWAFLLHIRECTLSAILSFLRHNGPLASGGGLVNEDTARRLVLLLSNGLAFSASFTTAHPNVAVEPTPSTSSRLQLVDRDVMFRRRLLQCFVAFGQSAATQQYQIQLLQQAVALFSDVDKYFGESALQAAASSGTFTSIWDETDGYGFGVTSLIDEGRNEVAGGGDAGEVEGSANRKLAKLNRDQAEARIEAQLRKAVLAAPEHDPLVLSSRLANEPAGFDPLPHAPPPSVGLVDAAIELFSLYFTLQEPANQHALLQILSNNSKSFKLEKNPGRRQAIVANSTTAILGALRLSRRAVDPHQVGAPMRELIKDSLLHPDAALRQAAAESLGRLSSLGGTSFMASQIQFCVTQVVGNTDPHNRAGCALAFSEIYTHVGSLAAGPVLKTVVDVLLSLSADPHPLVHFHALQSLSHVIDAASLSYAPFTNPTLGVLCKLYMQDTHEPEGGTPGSVNLRGDLPAYQAMCRVTDALIGVLGPELQESERVRQLVLILLKEFTLEKDDGIAVEAIKATQHFLIFAPDALDHATLVANLRAQLSSSKQPLKVAAVNSVYQLVQRDAALMSKLGGDGLVQELFALLDDDPSIEGVRDAILSWLRQTADAHPSGWIDLCQRIMSRSASTAKRDDAANAGPAPGALADEEVQGLGVEAEGAGRPGAALARTSSRWRTQFFALECLHEVFVTVVKSGRREHFDINRARAVRANKRGLLITRVADLIKMAFTASTAQVMEIRLEGLVVLKDVIDNFGASQDIDFEEALLLDQFQAPIAAALTPAFAADSYPEVLASAIQVCAVFVGSGVVKEVEKMGRILKLLTGALESCKNSDMTSLGDVQELSSTASVMLKTSIFAAWAQFQTASVRQPYLADVIRPHLPLLCPFWAASLREYARVRTDPDATSSDSGAGGAAFDSVYSGLSRETALPFYQAAWPQMLHAVATLLKASDPHMLRAIDGLDTAELSSTSLPSPTRADPAAFFWVLFGLAFEALCTSGPSSSSSSASTASIQSIALEALVGLLRPDVSGTVLKDSAGVFDEVCNLCYRLAITEGPAIRVRVLEIALQMARTFIKDVPVAATSMNGATIDAEAARNDPRLTQCLRVATTALRETIPATTSTARPTALTLQLHVEHFKAIFSLYADFADLFPNPLREELYAIAFHFYSMVLKDEKADVDLAGPTLPVLKLLSDRGLASTGEEGPAVLPKVINGMLSACMLNIDEVRLRKSAPAVLKTKNNLLATVLLLTSLPPAVKVGQEVVEHACFLISETALDGEAEASITATHCLTSLLLASSRPGGAFGVLSFCATQLVPTVVELVARTGERGYAANDPRLKSADEAVRALVAVLTGTGVAVERRTQALSILLPTLIQLLSPSSPAPPAHTLALAHLLALAGAHSAHFKEATAALPEEKRGLLEESIRASLGRGGGKAGREEREGPKIELKLFGQ